MKKFFYKYNLEMLSVFLIGEFVFTLLHRNTLSLSQTIIGVFALLIMLHEWEETRWPGGFFELMGGKMGIDLTSVDMGKCHLPTKILIFVFSTVPMLFDEAMVIVFVPIILMIFEMIVHIAGIFLHKMKKPYTPGLVTAVVMGLWGIWSAHRLLSSGTANAMDVGISIPLFVLCFISMSFGIVKLIGVDFKEIRANMMRNSKR